MMRRLIRALGAAMLAGFLGLAPTASAADPIRIAYVDPLSGAFAQQGDASLKMPAYVIGRANAGGGALGRKFELSAHDSNMQPAEALIALKSITDQNIPFVLQCAGSNVAAALIDGIAKHNARNPANRVLFLNCGSLASDLTNENCDFWHFRFVGNTGMRAAALVRALPKEITSVYLLNQDYLFGQTLHRETKEWLEKLRPDVKIAGEEFIPLGKIKDFSPYAVKIKASGAQSLVTGNWGPDLNLLLKAIVESGQNISFYTYLSHVVGAVTAVGPTAENRLYSVMEFHPNVPSEGNNPDAEAFVADWRRSHDFDLFQGNVVTMLDMLAAAITTAQGTDPLKVALALEDMTMKDLMGHENIMRRADHQMVEPFYVARLVRNARHDTEKTGLRWQTIARADVADLMQPSSCKMKRPTQ